MNAQSPRFVSKLADTLFEAVAEREQFIEALLHPVALPTGVLWLDSKNQPGLLARQSPPFDCETRLTWQPEFVDRVKREFKPGSLPLHAAGAYYCLDMSSVFAAVPLLSVNTPIEEMLDACAAPGGKSIFAWRALQPSRLICNEVIGKRHGALVSNLRRCQLESAQVTRHDPSLFNAVYPDGFDLVIVDAPCSGQSLGVKGVEAAGAFHPVTIKKNALRQRRIIASSLSVVRPGGLLLYSTCTFSLEENEAVIEWVLKNFPGIEAVSITPLASFRSPHSDHFTYRLYPQLQIGAGAFTCLLHRRSE